jgi:hypothetical protein
LDESVDVFVRGRDDADQLSDGDRFPVADELFPHNTGAPGDQLHDRLVRLDFGEHVTAGDGISLVLRPLDEPPLLHRRGERLHHDLRGHVS